MTEVLPRSNHGAAYDSYLTALATGDRPAAVALAGELLAYGVSGRALVLDLVCPAQEEVGRRWQANEWTVAREHAATAISEAVLDVVAAGCPGSGELGSVLVACAETEWHSLAARAVAEVVRIAGWRTTFLGPSSRPGILAQHLHDLGPDALALSCSRASALPRARRVIEAAREAGVPVLVGGRGFGADDTRARRLGADAWAATPQQALDLLAVLPAYTAAAPPVASPWLEEYAQLQLRGEQVLAVLAGDLARAPAERLEHALDFLAAALFAADDDILLDYVGWLRQALPARGTGVSEVALVLERCAQALPDLPHAHALLLRAAKTAHEVD